MSAACGCVSYDVMELDAQNPTLHYSDRGVFLGDRQVQPDDVPGILEDHDIPHDRVIHIRIDSGTRNLKEARRLMNCLAAKGYTRPVLVTKKHAEAINRGMKGRQGGAQASGTALPVNAPVRYKRAFALEI